MTLTSRPPAPQLSGMPAKLRLSLVPALVLALASCGGEGGPLGSTSLTVTATVIPLTDGTTPHALGVGIQNYGSSTIQAPLCGDGLIHYASAVRDQLVDGIWVPPAVAGSCTLADASVVVDVQPLETKDLLRMIIPNEVGTYRFRWTVPTSDNGDIELTSPAVTVTAGP